MEFFSFPKLVACFLEISKMTNKELGNCYIILKIMQLINQLNKKKRHKSKSSPVMADYGLIKIFLKKSTFLTKENAIKSNLS